MVYIQVCLVDIGQGTPFISGLDLRPLRAAMYPEATVNQSLLLLNLRRPAARFALNRYHFWRPASSYKLYRFVRSPGITTDAYYSCLPITYLM